MLRVVVAVAAEYGIDAIRIPLDTARVDAGPMRSVLARVLALLSRRAAKVAARAGLWSPDSFHGMAISGRLSAAHLIEIVENLPESGVAEIICHPGADNAALEAAFGWGFDWEGEFAAALSPEVRRVVETRGIGVTNFRDEARGRHPGNHRPGATPE